MKFIARICLILIALAIFLPIKTSAADDWYVKDFEQEIVVNKDSSLTITENITADAGNCSDCHGIFRILPTFYQKTADEKIFTPVYLISITDFNDRPIKYKETKDNSDYTITWKIGDANREVKGLNYYRIKYTVKNTIRFGDPKFDEFYWNLNGNYWDLDVNHFKSTIVFPSEIAQNNSAVDYYTGQITSRDKSLAKYRWASQNNLEFESMANLAPGDGITASVTFSKNIISQYQLSDEDQAYYRGSSTSTGNYDYIGSPWWLILPVLALFVSTILWFYYGRDPKINPTIVPEFEIPEKLSPMPMGVVITDGTLKSQFISAGIINLAVKGNLKIEEISKKGILGGKDYQLTLLNDKKVDSAEFILIEKLFGGSKTIKISDLKNEFYKKIDDISKKITDDLKKKELFLPRSKSFHGCYIALAIAFLVAIFFTGRNLFSVLSIVLTAAILFIFAKLMRQRTKEGAELMRKIKGFELYMKTAEKYRQQFNEKENIFERFLPYAMLFGITKLWMEKMKTIYSQDYFNTYHPVWFVGPSFANFDADNFDSALSAMSANMSSTMSSHPSSSGSGGGGFSGGGGGGGGGGGW